MPSPKSNSGGDPTASQSSETSHASPEKPPGVSRNVGKERRTTMYSASPAPLAPVRVQHIEVPRHLCSPCACALGPERERGQRGRKRAAKRPDLTVAFAARRSHLIQNCSARHPQLSDIHRPAVRRRPRAVFASRKMHSHECAARLAACVCPLWSLASRLVDAPASPGSSVLSPARPYNRNSKEDPAMRSCVP